MARKKLIFGTIFLLVGLVAGIILSVKLDIFQPAHSDSEKLAPLPTTSGRFMLDDAVINVAETVGNAVVSISSEYTTKVRGRSRYYFDFPFESPFGQDEFFRRFFEDFFGEMPEREYKQMGLGSGVIIEPEGYILTNEHVVGDADKITVTLPDGREFKGEIKGKDRRLDLAIIKIEAHNLPAASLGDSNSLKIGEWVVAIGNPFGFALENPEPTVTVGVVSALKRSLGRVVSRDKDFSDLIQTDAAINPGNSGGPLVNLKGEVVGINVAIFTTSGGYQGVGFAIPINRAKRILSKLIEGKKILYGWLGVTVQNLTDDLAQYFGLPDKSGVLVVKVLDDSPAQKGGIKESDIIVKLNDKDIKNVNYLLSSVAQAEVGRKVKVEVIREKKKLTLDVEIGERPEGAEEELYRQTKAGVWRGLEVEDLASSEAERFRLKEKEGLLVAYVEPDSPADKAGLEPGDVILEINRQPVRNIADYEKITKGIKADALVKISRGYFLVKGD